MFPYSPGMACLVSLWTLHVRASASRCLHSFLSAREIQGWIGCDDGRTVPLMTNASYSSPRPRTYWIATKKYTRDALSYSTSSTPTRSPVDSCTGQHRILGTPPVLARCFEPRLWLVHRPTRTAAELALGGLCYGCLFVSIPPLRPPRRSWINGFSSRRSLDAPSSRARSASRGCHRWVVFSSWPKYPIGRTISNAYHHVLPHAHAHLFLYPPSYMLRFCGSTIDVLVRYAH